MARRTTTTTRKQSSKPTTKAVRGDIELAASLRERPMTGRKKLKRLSREKLSSIASKLLGKRAVLTADPLLQLSARHPYDALGWLDFMTPRMELRPLRCSSYGPASNY